MYTKFYIPIFLLVNLSQSLEYKTEAIGPPIDHPQGEWDNERKKPGTSKGGSSKGGSSKGTDRSNCTLFLTFSSFFSNRIDQ